MGQRIRFAVIGCGAVARRHHVPALVAGGRAEIAVLCDPDPAGRSELKKRFHLSSRECADLSEVLADPAVDVVDICAPSSTHFDYARRAIEAGKHVLIEKPPVYRVEQAVELQRLSAARGVKAGVIFNYRYRDLIEQVQRARERGEIGTVRKVQIIHHANFVFSESPWLWNEARSKYMLYEFGIHFLDLLVHLCGEHQEVLSVVAGGPDGVKTTSDLQIVVRFKSGALGILDLTQDSTRHSSYFTHLHVYGTGSDAFVRFFPPLAVFTSGLGSPQDYLVQEFKTLARFVGQVLTRKFVVYRNHSHQRVLDMYLDWLIEGKPYPLTLEAAMPTLRLLNDLEGYIPAYQSASEGAGA